MRSFRVCIPHQIMSDKIKKNEGGGACNTYAARRGAYRILVGKPRGKGSLGRPKSRWEDNLKTDLRKK
jgi:hypothetical protein